MEATTEHPGEAAFDAADAGIALGGMAGSLGLLFKLAQLTAADHHRAHFQRTGLSPSAYTILRTIRGNPGLRQGHLAAVLRIKPALMTRLIRDFEDAGLVARRIPDDDRRTVTLTLTPEGAARLDRAAPHVTAAFAAEHHGLTAAEVARLQQLLQKYCGVTQNGTLRLPG
ncbi:MAG: MarR family transcriptional regulator [Gemmobacter sp.]|nr:MarR family transcriptional regulator [Gemmobacter sp.]